MKENKRVIISLTVVVVLLIATWSFVSHQEKKQDMNNNQNNQTENNKSQNDKTDTPEISNNELEEMGKMIFDFTSVQNFDGYLFYPKINLAYQTLKKIEYKDVNAFEITMLLLEENQFEMNPNYINTSTWYRRVKKDTFEKKLQSIFGIDKKLSYDPNDNYVNGLEKCELENEYIQCYLIEGGGDVEEQVILHYEKIEQNTNEIILTVKALSYVPEKSIADIDNNEIDNSKYADNLIKDRYNITDIEKEKLFQYYNNKIQGEFRLTFALDTSSNYYWKSTEYVK